MIFIVFSTIDARTGFSFADNEEKLKEIIGNFEGIGKPKSIEVYEAQKINYKFTFEEKEEIVMKKIPKLDILK